MQASSSSVLEQADHSSKFKALYVIAKSLRSDTTPSVNRDCQPQTPDFENHSYLDTCKARGEKRLAGWALCFSAPCAISYPVQCECETPSNQNSNNSFPLCTGVNGCTRHRAAGNQPCICFCETHIRKPTTSQNPPGSASVIDSTLPALRNLGRLKRLVLKPSDTHISM